MREIAGGVLLAVVILIFVLANFGWIVLGFSVLATAALTAVLLAALPDDYRNVIFLFAAGFAAVSAFGYWTHADKRFVIPDDAEHEDYR